MHWSFYEWLSCDSPTVQTSSPTKKLRYILFTKLQLIVTFYRLMSQDYGSLSKRTTGGRNAVTMRNPINGKIHTT